MIEHTHEVPHDVPFSYFQKPYQLSNWMKAKFFSIRCKRAVLQYILIKIVTSAFLFIVYPNFELRNRSQSDWDYKIYNHVNTFIYWFTTISSYIAFYYMGLLYNTLQTPLKPFSPELKFTTFNLTLFFTYWQKVWMVIFQNDILSCFDHEAKSFRSKAIMYDIEVDFCIFSIFSCVLKCY